MARKISEKGCKFAAICIVPGTGCLGEEVIKICTEAIRLKEYFAKPCPLCQTGKCDLPQYRGHMNDPDLCENAKVCPLSALRSIVPIRDFELGLEYGTNFPPASSVNQIVSSLRGIGL